MNRSLGYLILALLLGPAAAPLCAQGTKLPDDVARAKGLIEEHLDKIKNGKGAAILWLDQEPLPKAFPNHFFFAARYRVYPVAKVMPSGFRASNVFAVSKDGTLTHIKDAKGLQEFFAAHLAAVKDEKSAQAAVKASLLLTQEFRQDGFYKFTIIDESTKYDGKEATGKAVVMAGGNGELLVTLTFDAAGKLADIGDAGTKIKPGPRPICQATKLLDPDAIVRRMAEQDLLIMGPAAHDYLMEQRALADPQLREAIDRLWRRIVENE